MLCPSHAAPALSPVRIRALLYVLEAHETSQELHQPITAFACQLACLLQSGISESTLRWLLQEGLAEHQTETTSPNQLTRSFGPCIAMHFQPASCFLLSRAGVALAKALRDRNPVEADVVINSGFPSAAHTLTEAAAKFLNETDSLSANRDGKRLNGYAHANGVMEGRQVPVWNAETRELRVDGRLVKRFRRPAQVLELLLAAFQEMDWPSHLDDPLPPKVGIVQTQRLRDTVRRLNHCQEPHRIRFESNGLGAGIRWSWAD